MIYFIIIGVALVAVAALVVVLNRRGAHAPNRDETWRDAATRPDPWDHP
jgi:hypothetical protein